MQAYQISDGDARWFVRGTVDTQVALDFLLEEYPEAAEDAYPGENYGEDYEYVPVNVHAGLFRFSPCNCGDHGWHLEWASKRGRGVFEGVSLDVGMRDLVFDIDLPA